MIAGVSRAVRKLIVQQQQMQCYKGSEQEFKLQIQLETAKRGSYLTTKEVPVSVKPTKVDEDESEQLLNSLYAAATAWRRAATNHNPSSSSSACVIIGYIDGEVPNSSKLFENERRFQATNVISGFVKLLEEEGEGLLKSLQTHPQSYKEDIAEEEQDGIQNSRSSDNDWEIIEEEGQEESNHILANNSSSNS
nr:uncharacterized protein LOC109172746 isoform X1 [Ipomoea batatas]